MAAQPYHPLHSSHVSQSDKEYTVDDKQFIHVFTILDNGVQLPGPLCPNASATFQAFFYDSLRQLIRTPSSWWLAESSFTVTSKWENSKWPTAIAQKHRNLLRSMRIYKWIKISCFFVSFITPQEFNLPGGRATWPFITHRLFTGNSSLYTVANSNKSLPSFEHDKAK